LENLPANWIVVCLSAEASLDDLYITRITQGNTPVTFRLPMKRQAIREGEDDGFGLETLLTEMVDIISSNDLSAKTAAGIASENRTQTQKEKTEWWTTRRELNERLKDLLCHVEKYWIGGFKGLLLRDDFRKPVYIGALNEFKLSVEGLLTKAISGKAKAKAPILDLDLCCMILKLGVEPDPFDVEDILYYLMDAYQYAGFPIAYDEINIDAMEASLRESISKFHRHRILESETTEEVTRPHLVLVLDKKLQSIPWESLPCLRGTSISRVPNLCMLRDLLSSAAGEHSTPVVDKDDLYFVLNPSSDLVNTEKQFAKFLKGNPKWKGISNRAPTQTELEENLKSKSIFMYFGHGGAEQYVRGHHVRSLDRCAAAFLMGCSSGKLSAQGEFDVSGTALNYLMGGSPSIVGNLWDVTDRDIDRFTKTMLCRVGLAKEEMFPVEKSSRKTISKERCELKYLIGAAPVVYGIPVLFK
ncbi:peptidase family C50-domain-containing protein, partial [Obelidium mucronatum]